MVILAVFESSLQMCGNDKGKRPEVDRKTLFPEAETLREGGENRIEGRTGYRRTSRTEPVTGEPHSQKWQIRNPCIPGEFDIDV